MRKFPNLVPFALRWKGRFAPRRGRRIAVWSAAVATMALVGGVLQTASATSIFQTELVNTQTQLQSLSTDNKSLAGEEVTYKATVTADTGTPTGEVDFLEEVSPDTFQAITGCTNVIVTAGEATCEQTYNSVGSHTLKAQYSDPASIYEESESAEITQTVEQASTTTTLTSSDVDNATVSGESVTYTATVTANSPSGGTPEGTVTFYDGTTPICSSVSLVSGSADCITALLTVGSPHSVTAQYLGNADYTGSTSTAISQTVTQASTTTTLTSSDLDNATVTGESMTFTATVEAPSPGSGTPTGTVTFKSGTVDISSCILKQLTSGAAQCTTSFRATGSPHSVTAVYSGDDNYLTSTSSAISHAVAKANTTTAVSSGLNPSKTGQSVTYTAVVLATAPGAGFPGGSVHFKDGTTTVSTCSAVLLVDGQAQCTASYNTVGDRSITAVYSGSDDYVGSTSPAITQVVNYAYGLTATGGSNGTFKISGTPRLANYRLCVRYFGYEGVQGDWPAVTPPPKQGSGIHRFGLNFEGKCKKQSWSSGTSHTERLMDASLGSDDFGFATRGTYEVKWYTCTGTCSSNGALIGTDKFHYDSWCPPDVGGFRQMGVWRPGRHKVVDRCYSGVATSSGLDAHFDKDRSVNWGGWHNEFVARDWIDSYGAPNEAIGDGRNGYSSGRRRMVGFRLKDAYHRCKTELHPVYMVQKDPPNGGIFLGGPQYSTKTPSISGTWKKYAC